MNPVIKSWLKAGATAAFQAGMIFIATNGAPTDQRGYLALVGAVLGGLAALFTHSPLAVNAMPANSTTAAPQQLPPVTSK